MFRFSDTPDCRQEGNQKLENPEQSCAKLLDVGSLDSFMTEPFWKQLGNSLLSTFSKHAKIRWHGEKLMVGFQPDFEKRKFVEDFLQHSKSQLDHCKLGFMFLVDLIVLNSKQGFVTREQFRRFLQRYALYVKRERMIDMMRMTPRFAEELKIELAEITFNKE